MSNKDNVHDSCNMYVMIFFFFWCKAITFMLICIVSCGVKNADKIHFICHAEFRFIQILITDTYVLIKNN